MGPGIAILWIIVIAIFISAAKKKTAEKKQSDKEPAAPAGRPQTAARTAARPAAPYSRSCADNVPKQLTNEQIRKLDISRYSHCSDFSFRNLPEGTDELEALIRHNREHEKELERHMHMSTAETVSK